MNCWTISVGLSSLLCLASLAGAQPPFQPGGPINQNANFPGSPALQTPTADPLTLSSANDPQTPTNALPLEIFEPGKLVAQVGDQPILYGEILGDLNQIVEQEMPDASDRLKEMRRKALFEQLLPRMIEQKMVYTDFLRNMPDESRLPDIMKQLDEGFYDTEVPSLLQKTGVNNLSELDVKLRSMGTSLRNVKRAWRESQIVGYYIGQKFQQNREVTHQEMLTFYRDHLADYETKARVRWEQLMVKYDQFPDRQAARLALEAMGNEVVFGAPLDAVAKRSSHGPMATNGGQYDWTDEGSLLNKKIEEQLFTLRLNYLSDVIETEQGLHIVRVKERVGKFYKPFVEVQTEIKERLAAKYKKEQIAKFLERLEKEIPVWTILDEEAEESARATNRPFQLPIR